MAHPSDAHPAISRVRQSPVPGDVVAVLLRLPTSPDISPRTSARPFGPLNAMFGIGFIVGLR